jgi:parallel beta-helix repeat protein
MRRVGLVVAVSILAMAVLPAASGANHLDCGDVVTQSVTLDSDIGPCPGDALVVGADGVQIDLAGHSIRGSGGGSGPVLYAETADGVEIDEHNDVTVANGAITNFDVGVNVYEATGTRIDRVESHHNRVGALLVEASAGSITRSDMHDDGYGVYLYEDSDSNLIANNSMAYSAFGLYLDKASENTIWHNALPGNLIYGIEVAIASNHNSIRFNTISNTVSEGVLISASVGNKFTDNVVRDTAFAGPVTIGASPQTVVARNFVVNTRVGERTAPGVWVNNGSNGVILSRNVIRNQPTGVEVHASRVLISRNDISGSGGDGIGLRSGTGTMVDRNTSSANGDDGIDFDAGTATLSQNTANSNRDLGIESLPGTDGGGNRASGNGNPAQCTGVVCK